MPWRDPRPPGERRQYLTTWRVYPMRRREVLLMLRRIENVAGNLVWAMGMGLPTGLLMRQCVATAVAARHLRLALEAASRVRAAI